VRSFRSSRGLPTRTGDRARLLDVTRLLALYPAAVAVLLLALPLIAPRSGPLTLANIFSVHLASAAVLLAPVAVLWRDRVLRGSLVALAAVALARFGGDWVSVPSSGDTFDGSFATASWNLELGARAGSAAVDALQTIDVDVIALQELGPDHARSIEASEALKRMYPYRELYPEPGVLGMGVLSRHPIVRAEFRQDPSLVEAVLDVDGTEVTLINVHPLAGRLDMVGPIPVGFDTAKRDERLGRSERGSRTRSADASRWSYSAISTRRRPSPVSSTLPMACTTPTPRSARDRAGHGDRAASSGRASASSASTTRCRARASCRCPRPNGASDPATTASSRRGSPWLGSSRDW
jgi:hypothetical protein